MNLNAAWDRIPYELRQCKQWVIAGADKVPLTVTAEGSLAAASIVNPEHWLEYKVARDAALEHGLGIGFVLHPSDPYTCIDLDAKDASNESDPSRWTTQEQFDRFWRIAQSFNSYTETSRSGKGLHIWVRGNIGTGGRRDGVEVYSQGRYIICTGQVVIDQPIKDEQARLDSLVAEIRGPKENELPELVELEEEFDDSEIINRAMYALNGEKFNDLCNGDWKKYNFPSQSEADLALMSMLAFYSKSNEQCRRLFRITALGKREKAVKNDRYLNYTLRLIRARQMREAEQSATELERARAIANNLIAQYNEQAQVKAKASAPLHIEQGTAEPRMMPTPAPAAATLAGPTAPSVAAAGGSGLPWPPGMAGAIAGFIYQSAPRPVKEVSVVAALGLLAGICGKAFYIPQSGLNIYLILVARSAVGKEALHSGISALCKAVTPRCPHIMEFVEFSDFASGPALVKTIVNRQSVVNVAAEWGRKLKRMAQDDGRDGSLATLRTVMTNLYQKSGPQSLVGGITYSNKENNIASVNGVAYSMIGETTPSTFYESLTDSMMEDGFLSRFTIVEYDGERPPPNANLMTTPSEALTQALADLAQYAYDCIMRDVSIPVGRTNAAAKMMAAFDKECDSQINSTKDESWRQMWNRASLKAMRISALLGVADNWLHPVVTEEHVTWALDLIRRDIDIMRRRLESGDVGLNDHTRERKLIALIKEFLANPIPAGYDIPQGMREAGIVPRKYLQIRAARVAAFTQHRNGVNAALRDTINALIEAGYIAEVEKATIVQKYSFHGKCYAVLNLPNYDAERMMFN